MRAKCKFNKNGKPLKFSRDLESDWVVQNDKPVKRDEEVFLKISF